MLYKHKFEITQKRPLRPVFLGGSVVDYEPEDCNQPYGLEVSIFLKHGKSELPLIRELLDKLREIEQVLDAETKGN